MVRDISLSLTELVEISNWNKSVVWNNVSDNQFELDKVYLVSDGIKQWFGFFRDRGCDDEFEPVCFNRDNNEVLEVILYAELPELPKK